MPNNKITSIGHCLILLFLSCKGSFGQVRGPQPNYGAAYPGTPNYGIQPGPPPPPKRLDPDSIPSPVSLLSYQCELFHSVFT